MFVGGAHDYGAPQERHMLEEENDRMVDDLSNKVQALKSVSQFYGRQHSVCSKIYDYSITIAKTREYT